MGLKIVLLVSWTRFCCFSVSAISCPMSNYTKLQGRITSGSYGENPYCKYNINLPPGRRITLELKTLSALGTMPDCDEDSLEIIVGCFRKISIGKFCSCSNVSMPKLYSYDNCMALVFKSKGSKKGAGFEAEYFSSDNSGSKLDPTQNCSNKLIKQSSGTMFTPNWPLHYPSLIACNWLFHIPEGKVARIFFTSFEVDPSAICDENRTSLSGDDIRINGTTTAGRREIIKKRLCELPHPAFFSVRDMRTVQVKFESNARGEYSGVVLGYATYSEGTLDSGMAGCEEKFTPLPTAWSTTTERPSGTAVPIPHNTGVPTVCVPHGLSVPGILIWYIFCR